MEASRVLRIIVVVCRAIQVPVAIITLPLITSLIPPFKQLNHDCIDEIAGIKCRRFGETLGGLRFSIGTCVIALVDVSFGIVSISGRFTVPAWLVITLDSLTAGCYLGSGSTIAARLNGELCEGGPSDPTFACDRLFAVMGFFFVGAVTAYTLVACYWVSRARERRTCDEEVDQSGHALQNPFRNPPVGAEQEAGNENGLNKRRSWSQLS